MAFRISRDACIQFIQKERALGCARLALLGALSARPKRATQILVAPTIRACKFDARHDSDNRTADSSCQVNIGESKGDLSSPLPMAN